MVTGLTCVRTCWGEGWCPAFHTLGDCPQHVLCVRSTWQKWLNKSYSESCSVVLSLCRPKSYYYYSKKPSLRSCPQLNKRRMFCCSSSQGTLVINTGTLESHPATFSNPCCFSFSGMCLTILFQVALFFVLIRLLFHIRAMHGKYRLIFFGVLSSIYQKDICNLNVSEMQSHYWFYILILPDYRILVFSQIPLNAQWVCMYMKIRPKAAAWVRSQDFHETQNR